MVKAALIVCALAACADDRYECHSDSDCDLGEAGRCEVDHHCTRFDQNCDTGRRYTAHSGDLSNACFDDHVTPRDLCAAGQPPAVAEGCIADVCTALPTCCHTGWSDACVQQAQMQCASLTCDTRIALGTRGPRNELWDLEWNSGEWTANAVTAQKSALEWLAPGPGEDLPHLAAADTGVLTIDGVDQEITSNFNVQDMRSVDFDRDGRPTMLIGYTDGMTSRLQVRKLDDGSLRTIDTVAVVRMSWGDVDGDAFPDGIAETNGSATYRFLKNVPLADRSRAIDDNTAQTVNGNGRGTVPALRSFDWLDENGDHKLDVVAFGWNANVHLFDQTAIDQAPAARWDCDPPSNFSGCGAPEELDASFAGAALPRLTSEDDPVPQVFVLASHPARELWRAERRGGNLQATPYRLPASTCTVPTGCPFIAVVVRDLDGDHQLDVIAIDNELKVYVAHGGDGDGLDLREEFTIPTTIPKQGGMAVGFFAVRLSVSGAVTP